MKRLARVPIAVWFVLIAAPWIAFSDRLVFLLAPDAQAVTRAQTVKGWAFVAASAVLILTLEMLERRRQARARAALEASELRFASLFGATPVATAILRLRDGAVLDVNRHFLATFGYDGAGEVLGRSGDRPLWRDPDDRRRALDRLRREGQVRGLEADFVRRDGTIGRGLAYAEVVRVAGEELVLAMVSDVSELHQTRLEREEQAVEIAGLNAELRTRVERLAALRRVDKAIHSRHELDDTLVALLDETRASLEVDGAAVLLADAAGWLRQGPARGVVAPFDEARGAIDAASPTLPVRAAATLRTLHLGDTTEDADALRAHPGLAAAGVRSYWAAPLVAGGRLRGVLELFHRGARHRDEAWRDHLASLASLAALAIDTRTLLEGLEASNLELTRAYDRTIEGWSRALDLRDEETEGHSQRVTAMAVLLAQRMGITGDALVQVRRGALLHDIGKMGVPDAILLKPGPLDEEEWAVMRRHPGYGRDLLAPIAFLRPALAIPYAHHERWDGTGYPEGLAGEQIPLAARVFAVVDVFDALTNARPYRPAWTRADALAHVRRQAGRHFDPAVVRAFLEMLEEVERELADDPRARDAAWEG